MSDSIKFEGCEYRIEEGDWIMRCVRYDKSGAFGGRFNTEWVPQAGPIRNGIPTWKRGAPDPARFAYDDPATALITAYYPVEWNGGRLKAAARSNLARDYYRLTGKIAARLDRFPVEAFEGAVALVRVRDVTLDHQGLPCPPYSRIEAILRSVPDCLSNDPPTISAGTET